MEILNAIESFLAFITIYIAQVIDAWHATLARVELRKRRGPRGAKWLHAYPLD